MPVKQTSVLDGNQVEQFSDIVGKHGGLYDLATHGNGGSWKDKKHQTTNCAKRSVAQTDMVMVM